MGGHSAAYFFAISMEETWTMRGLVLGRPFNSKTFATAAAFSAFAPRPYTVSVGNATTTTSRMRPAASVSEIVFNVFTICRRLSCFPEYEIRVDQCIQIAVEHAIHVAHRKLGAMVLDQPVRR